MNLTPKQETYSGRLIDYFSDEFADVLIAKLSTKDLDTLITECERSEREYLSRWAERTMKLGLQRDRLKEIERAATQE